MDKINALILSNDDWTSEYNIPEYIDVEVSLGDALKSKKLFDITIIDRNLLRGECKILRNVTKAYTVFFVDAVDLPDYTLELYNSRMAATLNKRDIQSFLDEGIRNFFSKPYGEKYSSRDLCVSSMFSGDVSWNGGFDVEISGDFGEEYQQIAYWKSNIPIYRGQCIEYYLEYNKSDSVSVNIEISLYAMGYVSKLIDRIIVSEEELKDVFLIDNKEADCFMFVNIMAKGRGELHINALHDRYSRRGYGTFLPGGERYMSSRGEEIFAYFDPGDMKPPLSIYYSGFKTMEGFEGYFLMKNMNGPFLLLAEARLDGGAFYIGDDEYEEMMVNIIKDKMNYLGFTSDEVVMSGLSMGTTGAIYYACDIQPHAVVAGKPLVSIGNIAQNEQRFRPGGFPTSLDVLNKNTGGMDEVCIETINNKMWNKVRKADFSKTKFVVSYMIEDDYDSTAYEKLISNLASTGATIVGKGLHGRHNDNSYGIVTWFSERYKNILREDFKREI